MKTSAFRNVNNKHNVILGLKNVTFDICRALSGGRQSILYDIMVMDLEKYSNVMHPCPFSVLDLNILPNQIFLCKISFNICERIFVAQGHMYIKDCIINDSKFPPVLTPGDYYVHNILQTRVSTGKPEWVVQYKLFGRIHWKSFSINGTGK